MGFLRTFSFIRKPFAFVLVSLTFGCAVGGSGVANGPGTQAIGGSATVNVSVPTSLRLSLGDAAIAAASRELVTGLMGLPGPIGDAEKKQTISKAIEAAERIRGLIINADDKMELEQQLGIAVEDYKTRYGK
jgi:hypothetical protein